MALAAKSFLKSVFEVMSEAGVTEDKIERMTPKLTELVEDYTTRMSRMEAEVDLQKSGGSSHDGLDGLNDLDEYDDGSQKIIPLRGPWNADKRSRYVELVLVVAYNFRFPTSAPRFYFYRRCCDQDFANCFASHCIPHTLE